MKDDVEGLRRLIKLQEKETGGNTKTGKSTSLDAKDLMERYGIKFTADNKSALQNQLSALYYAISSSQSNQDISWGDAQKSSKI